MSRIHGRRGRLYVGLASDTAAAEPVSFLTKWTLDAATDDVDVTALGDSNKIYVSGLPDASGSFNGWYDTASAGLYTVARDGLPRKFYLYPTIDATGQYFFGTGLFDFHIEGGVGEAISTSGNWKASSDIIKVG